MNEWSSCPQRRRWGPSTMANLMDLISSWGHTIRNNENISTIYMMYQVRIKILLCQRAQTHHAEQRSGQLFLSFDLNSRCG